MSKKKILVVEDDIEIALLEKDYLEIHDFEVEVVADGDSAILQTKKNTYDLILLDIMLPSKNGYEICREVRNLVKTPILIVSAKSESADKILGLGLGADDYITKPFDPAELVARVKAHIARNERLFVESIPEETSSNIQIGNVAINPQSWVVKKNDVEIHFSNREFNLLLFLAEHPNIVFSKEHLFETIWGFDYSGDSATVTVHVNRIREKIEDDPKNPTLIETIWGVGYRLNLR